MKVQWKSSQLPASVWGTSFGNIGKRISCDTETTRVDGPDVPDYVIGTVFNGREVYFLRREDLVPFWKAHESAVVYMHTAAFDIAVMEKAAGIDFGPAIEGGRVVDVAILWRLVELARRGDLPHRYNLAEMSGQHLGVKLDKDAAVRCDFGRFLRDGVVHYGEIPAGHLAYAALDAVATFELGEILLPEAARLHHKHHAAVNPCPGFKDAEYFGPLTHDIQLRADIALREIERLGIGVDLEAVEAAATRLQAGIDEANAVLARYGYRKGEAGNTAAFDRVVGKIARERGVELPTTARGSLTQAEAELRILEDHEFVGAFIRAKKFDKLLTTYIKPLRECGGRIHARHTLLLKTGRTSCSRPNIQNLPREGGVRECFVPEPGRIFVATDYRMLELCTLAQILYSRYGRSNMRDLINQGVDLHRYTASRVLRKPIEKVTPEDRQKAKALNFGVPGGMGVNGLVRYAGDQYGVTLSPDEAEQWKAGWLDLFPEMRDYLADDSLSRLAAMLEDEDLPECFHNGNHAALVLLRVAGGALETSGGRPFEREEIDWAWETIGNIAAASRKKFADKIDRRAGSREIQKAITADLVAVTRTGRVRARCGFCESRNTPFQGLAADGAKLALYDLVSAGHRVVAFVHDEVLVEVPEADDYRPAVESISRIMIEAMNRVCPDIDIKVEHTGMRRWSKDPASQIPLHGGGKP